MGYFRTFGVSVGVVGLAAALAAGLSGPAGRRAGGSPASRP
jgi:hypothetical protein